MINNQKIFFVNSLNIFTTCRILRLFPLASKCEIMTLLNKSLLLHWTKMCRFPGATFVFSPYLCEILIIDVITILNWFPGCEKPICRLQKHISTLFGSKVMAHFLDVAAILDFVL